ncbi:MAG: hypothetical protein ABJ275_02655 [Maricaulaceae bacterium]
MKIITHVILTSCLFALAGCAEVNAQDKAQSKHDHFADISSVKPGAAVSLSHDYDGHTELGALETVTLSISHLYKSGMLSAAILPSSGLDIISDTTPQQTEISVGSVMQLYVQFSTLKSGAYNLNVEIIHEDRFGQQMRRTLSVPIMAGDVDMQKKSGFERAAANKVKSTGLIVLPAQEIIR